MCYSMTWKIGLGVLIISVLAWLPQGVTPALTWWGPAPCWAGDGPEVIVTHSVIKDNSLTGINPHSNAIISHSFAGFKGISQVNQASGFMSNQMNVVSISNSPGQLNPEHQRSWVADNNNTLTGENHRNCSITGGSYKHAAGIVEVNQSAGSMNTQLNAVALTIGKKGCTSLSDGDLDGFCTPPTKPNEAIGKTKISCDSDPRKESLKFRGIYNSNQISGDQSSGKTLTTVNIIPGSFHP
jgi:hypothetical protein